MSPFPTRSAQATYTVSLWSGSTAIESVGPMRSWPRVGAFDQGIVTWVATRRPGRLSDGSTRWRNGAVPVAPLSSRTTTTSLVTFDPTCERQPKYATYTVWSRATAGRIDGPFCPRVVRVSRRRDAYVTPPSSETSTVALCPSGASKSLRPTYTRSALAPPSVRTNGWSMSARDACSVIGVTDRKSVLLSSFKGRPGTLMRSAYSTGGLPPTACVISAVIDWLGSVLRSVQEAPPSFDTKMGAVALFGPPGLGVKAEAAMSCGFESYSARNGSASCPVSPLSEAGIKSTTRAPATWPGGA